MEERAKEKRSRDRCGIPLIKYHEITIGCFRCLEFTLHPNSARLLIVFCLFLALTVASVVPCSLLEVL